MSNQVTLNITGMKCGGCVSAVEDALKAVDAVESVNVSLDKNDKRILRTAKYPHKADKPGLVTAD